MGQFTLHHWALGVCSHTEELTHLSIPLATTGTYHRSQNIIYKNEWSNLYHLSRASLTNDTMAWCLLLDYGLILSLTNITSH